jgi:hypothetical protein
MVFTVVAAVLDRLEQTVRLDRLVKAEMVPHLQ